MRAGKALPVLAVLFVMGGCESAEEKCKKARAATHSGWAGYVEALDRARKQAVATQGQAHQKLSGEVERRLAPAAQKAADGRYDRSSEAWLRAYQSGFNTACAQDAECSVLKRRNSDAQAAIDDLTERLGPANAAAQAALGAAEASKQASEAVIIHPEYPQVKVAQLLALESYERCKDLPPPKDESTH